jgi:hypothetical protein
MFVPKSLKTVALLAGLLAGSWAGAGAAAITYSDCIGPGYDLTGNVSGAVDCEISSVATDSVKVSPMTVNRAGGFFDINTWEYEGKLGSAGLTGTASGKSGTYDLSALLAGLTGDIMLVFKGPVGTTLVAYQLDLDNLAGTWTTPFDCDRFTCGANGQPKWAKYVSVYSNLAPIPLPAAGLMLVGALGGLALVRRRKAA